MTMKNTWIAAAMLSVPVTTAAQEASTLLANEKLAWTDMDRALLHAHAAQTAQARAILGKIELGEDSPAYYNAACVLSIVGDRPAAMKALAQAVELGRRVPPNSKPDPDLSALFDEHDFRELQRRMTTPPGK